MMRKLAFVAAGIAGLLLGGAAASAADEEEPALPKVHWSFEGPLGTFDRAAAQRGFQIYEEMFQRPGRASDKFVAPFANEQAARAALNGALPPDLSLIVKALEGGPSQVFGILTGYRDPPPPGFKLGDGMYYDLYFPGHQIAMPQPLAGSDVTYADGAKPTLEQEAQDVVTFLAWAAEPTMEERKYTGTKVLIFLVFMTGLLFGAKRKIWADVH